MSLPHIHIPFASRRSASFRPAQTEPPSGLGSSSGPSQLTRTSPSSPTYLSPDSAGPSHPRSDSRSSSHARLRRRRSTGLSVNTQRSSSSVATGTGHSQASWDEVSESVDDAEGDGDEEEEWEGGEALPVIGESLGAWARRNAPGKGKGREGTGADKGEMKPLTVVFYMLALYFIFGILTRSDELEIMPHLPSSHPAAGYNPSARSDAHHPSYPLPYHLPHLPSPHVPEGVHPSTPRLVLGWLIYPFYLAITLLTIPIPMLFNIVYLVWQILRVVVSPLTAVAGLALRFVLFPFGVLKGVVDALYPVWVLVGGTIGAGAVLGGTVGWAGSWVLDKLTGRRTGRSRTGANGAERRRRRVLRRHSSRLPPAATSATTPTGAGAGEAQRRRPSPSSGEELTLQTPEPVTMPSLVLVQEGGSKVSRRVSGLRRVAEWDQDESTGGGAARTTGRKEVAMGTRRRGHPLEAEY